MKIHLMVFNTKFTLKKHLFYILALFFSSLLRIVVANSPTDPAEYADPEPRVMTLISKSVCLKKI